MKIKLIISVIMILFAFGCSNSNEPTEPNARYLYYLKNNSDNIGMYVYNSVYKKSELMSMKKIKLSTQIADNGIFVILEEKQFKKVNFYGICEGSLIEVPMPEYNSSNYETAHYNIDINSYPMQIDKSGHNFVFMTYFKSSDDEHNLFPILARFNCEEWKMNIINFKEDFLKMYDKEFVSIIPNPNLVINSKDEIFFSVYVENDLGSENLLLKVVNDKLENIFLINSPSQIKLRGCISNMNSFIFIETDYGQIIKKYEITADKLIEINQNTKMNIDNSNNNIYKNYYYSFKDNNLIQLDLNSGIETILLSEQQLNELYANAEPKECIVSGDGTYVAFVIKKDNLEYLYYLDDNNKAVYVESSDEIDILSFSGEINN